MNRHHDLKTLAPFYEAVIDGRKTFEIRLNDRDFAVGDILRLLEVDLAGHFTGRETTRKISYMTDFEQKPGFVVMALEGAGLITRSGLTVRWWTWPQCGRYEESR